MGSLNQQYCLRWNNHRSNLLLVFEHLFQTEAFTDVTLACDGHSIKCHKMVLAACSSYFQQLFLENDCRHPIVILKDILYSELKAILEYMYKGEVNVSQDQLSGLLKAAEALKVKGLVEDHQRSPGTPPPHQSTPYHHPPGPNSARPSRPPSSQYSAGEYEKNSSPYNNNRTNSIHTTSTKFIPNEAVYELSSSYNQSSLTERNTSPFPGVWSASQSPSQYGNPNSLNFENTPTEPIPMALQKRKRDRDLGTGGSGGGGSVNSNSKDTPILRTVLGHTSLHNSEPQLKSLNYSLNNSTNNNTNGPTDRDSPDTFMEDPMRSADSDKIHEGNHSIGLEIDDKQCLAAYVSKQNQKPEWKRYKQYTRNDILAAIEAVKAGMSALQASRQFNVPSRTLYDKVKKLGITTHRPYRKGSFPMSPYQGMNQDGKMDDGSSFSPEDQPLDISGSGNGNGITLHGPEGDSDKMDSDPGSGSIKQENSPPASI